MAGIAISRKQNTSYNNNKNNNNNTESVSFNNISLSKTANLNIILNTPKAKVSYCLWLQQLQVAESNNNNKCNNNARLMKDIATNYYSNSGSIRDDRIATTFNNYNIILRKQQKIQKHHITPGVAVIIMSLIILLVQMPTFTYSKSVYGNSSSLPSFSSEIDTSLESQPETQSQFLSLAAKTGVQDTSYSSSSALLDVLNHIQHTRQHQRERRMRLRKRHTGDLIITKYLHENAHNLEWKNPCNVDRVSKNTEVHHVNKNLVYQYLKKLENDVGMEYEFINVTATKININDIADWSKHDEVYKFLPKLSANGSIALSRWYRNMQVYVASFGYLARIQYKFDKKKQVFADDTSQELNKLLLSARFILCELETTINSSAPNNNLKKLKTISRKSMNSRLNFVTKHQVASSGSNDVVAANIVDLKFAKYSYFQYLKYMHNIVNRKLQNKGKKYGFVDNKTEDASSNAVIVGDDNSSIDFSSIFKSDASLSLSESVEMLLKTTKKPHGQRHRQKKKRNS